MTFPRPTSLSPPSLRRPSLRARTRALVPLALAMGCGGESRSSDPTPVSTPGASLVASPSTVTLSDSQPRGTLSLTTTPSGGRLTWQVTAKPAWLTVEPERGVVSGITPVSVTATIPANAEPGTLSGRLELVSDGGAAAVTITTTVASNPRLAVSASPLSVPAGTDTGTVTLSNPGRGFVQWTATSSQPWLTVVPSSGYLGTGQSAAVKLVPNRQPLPAGTSEATVTFRSNARNGDVVLPVAVVVPSAPRASVPVGRLTFSPATPTRTFHLQNTGKGLLTWRVEARDPWLTVSPTSGAIAPRDSVLVTVTASQPPAGATVGALTIASDAVDAPSLPIVATYVTATPPAGVRLLDHRVVDAEFSARAGLLVTVSADPARLNVFDVETGESYSIGLPKAPCCVAIRQDGRFAAVAHDAALSYVDLSARRLVATHPTTSDAIDVVLAMNGHAYVFPRTDQWVPIHGIDLATGREVLSTSHPPLYAGTRMKLHPGEEFLYGIWALSPADIEKWDIRAGRAARLGDSPYHGDHAMGYSLWISQDGGRLFTEAGTVFRASSSASEDMRYAGRLPGLNGARMVGDSPARGRIYALGTSAAPGWPGIPAGARSAELHVFDSSTLSALGSVALPRIPAGGRQIDADGYFVFSSLAGDRVYVLMKALPSSGLAQDWALVTVDVSTLP